MSEAIPSKVRALALALTFAATLLLAAALAVPGSAQALDAANLPAGTYTADVQMVNAAKYAMDDPQQQLSMSDKAVDKPIHIVVDAQGNYRAVMGMHGLDMGRTSQILFGENILGYLKTLYYWDGSQFQEATVESTYDLVDRFNDENNDGVADFKYAKQLSFPLINKAAGDLQAGSWGGVVRLQVFVPIMEAISDGTGTQQVYMKIHWDTLKAESGSSDAGASVASGGVTYQVAGSAATVTGIAASAKSATVKSTVTIDGTSYQVTSIAAKAGSKAKNLAKLTIGANVKTIGKQAFKNCKKLKTVTFQGTAVKTIGSQAFKGIAKKATFKVPKSKKAAYKKLIKKAGAPAGFKVK